MNKKEHVVTKGTLIVDRKDNKMKQRYMNSY